MNDAKNDVTQVLHPLRDHTWPSNAAAHNRIEQRLLAAHAANRSAGFAARVFALVARHRLAAASIALAAVAGGAIAGTYLFNRLYSITIRDEQGQIISAPRILVVPGQKASISISDPNDPAYNITVTIDGEGNVTSNRNDVNVDVDVEDVEAEKSEPK